MAGMDEVGRQFNANQLIVAEVLQSAEAMKFAVAHLEPYMERTDAASRGQVLLATVKGDVHDIGKNLVEIILSNNGYRRDQLGHQGCGSGTDRGLPGAPTGHNRVVGIAGEVGPDDGRNGPGLPHGRHRCPGAGRWRGPVQPVQPGCGSRRSTTDWVAYSPGRHDRIGLGQRDT